MIGVLLSTYGVILLVLGVFGDTEADKTGDVNANLWAGLVMLLIGCRVPGLGPYGAPWWCPTAPDVLLPGIRLGWPK